MPPPLNGGAVERGRCDGAAAETTINLTRRDGGGAEQAPPATLSKTQE